MHAVLAPQHECALDCVGNVFTFGLSRRNSQIKIVSPLTEYDLCHSLFGNSCIPV